MFGYIYTTGRQKQEVREQVESKTYHRKCFVFLTTFFSSNAKVTYNNQSQHFPAEKRPRPVVLRVLRPGKKTPLDLIHFFIVHLPKFPNDT